jgi:peptidyl-prolyl cis-trans isomerase C
MENKVLATVGAIQITAADVDEFIMGLGQRGQMYNNAEGRAMILDQIIDSKLLLLDARRNLLEGEAEFRAQLAKLKDNLLVNYAASKAVAAVTVATEAEAKAFYDENPDKFAPQPTVNASHILVDSEEKATEILAKINSGDITFETAAEEYSSCPSGKNGGSLGDFGRGQMVAEFDSAVFSMQVGEITSAPVKTQFGYHLIKLNSKSEGEATPFAEVKDSIIGMLTSEKQKKAFESKINQLKIMYPVNKTV